MTEETTIKLVRENERMRASLRAIRTLAANATFGGWRQQVLELTHQGLNQ